MLKFKFLCILTSAMMFLSVDAFAQKITVRGTVSDDLGPVIGAVVIYGGVHQEH